MPAFFKENRFVAAMSCIAAVVGMILPSPEGGGPLFSYGFAVIGALVGVIFAPMIERISGKWKFPVVVLLILLLAVFFGVFYMVILLLAILCLSITNHILVRRNINKD